MSAELLVEGEYFCWNRYVAPRCVLIDGGAEELTDEYSIIGSAGAGITFRRCCTFIRRVRISVRGLATAINLRRVEGMESI